MTASDSPDDRRPVVSPPFVPVAIGPDTIQFRIGPWAGPMVSVRDEDADGRLADLLEQLDGRPREAILEAFDPMERPEISTVLDRLRDEGVIVDATVDETDLLGGYVSTHPAFRGDASAVESSTVLLVDAGGDSLGPAVVEDLQSIGVGEVQLLRVDTEPADIPDGVTTLPPSFDLTSAIESADAVAFAAESPRPELIAGVNRAAHESGTPWVPGRVHGLDGLVGPAVLPGRSSCHACFRERRAATLEHPERYHAFETAARDHGSMALPAAARVTAGYLALDLLRLLIDGIGFTIGRVLHFDFFDLSVESNSVLKLPRCPVCGPSERSTLDWSRFVGLSDLGDDS